MRAARTRLLATAEAGAREHTPSLRRGADRGVIRAHVRQPTSGPDRSIPLRSRGAATGIDSGSARVPVHVPLPSPPIR